MSEPEDRVLMLYRRVVNGREIAVYPMSFGKARLVIGDESSPFIDDGYCYADPKRAIEAAKVWTGEGDPLDGWHRQPSTGRRPRER